MQTIRIIVKGKVQGVFYRAFTKEIAEQFGIKGWVKNLTDKSVEIKATSTEEKLKNFISILKQGPPRSKVEEMIIEELTIEHFSSFRILR